MLSNTKIIPTKGKPQILFIFDKGKKPQSYPFLAVNSNLVMN